MTRLMLAVMVGAMAVGCNKTPGRDHNDLVWFCHMGVAPRCVGVLDRDGLFNNSHAVVAVGVNNIFFKQDKRRDGPGCCCEEPRP